jgi:Chaperone of endosialidase
MVILPVLACFAFLPGAQAACKKGCDNTTFSTFVGEDALLSNTGSGNTAVGWRSLFSNIDGSFSTGIGGGALSLNNGSSNTAVGAAALLLNTTGTLNTAVGTDALVFNDSGSENNAVGAFALFNNVTGNSNNAQGHNALTALVGAGSLFTGSGNNAFGGSALDTLVDGDGNTAVGDLAGDGLVTGQRNTYIGSDIVVGDESDTIRIGNPSSAQCFIAGIVGAGPFSSTVTIDPATGQLGELVSSERFKKDIDPMNKASEAIFSLKPVTFHYKKDKTNTAQFGLIAEEVAKVNPALIGVDKEGKPYTVRYEAVNAMLLNEFLKEHKKVEEQQASISQLKSEMQTMVAQLKEQAAQIQKVSAQLEVSKPAPQVVVNKP